MASAPPQADRSSGDPPMLSLGLFVFSLATLTFDELQRKMDWRHAKSERQGARAASQFLGPGEDTISLPGSIVPGVSGKYSSLQRLREMATTGDAWPLVDGSGTVLGQFRIVAIDESQTYHVAGGLARRIDFGLDLERAD